MSEENKGSGAIGVGLGAAAAGGTFYATSKFAGNKAITEATVGTLEAVEGKKATFAEAVKKAGAAPLKEGAAETAGAALKSANEVIKPAEGAAKATAEALKVAKETRSEALATIRNGLKADKVSLMKNINGKHLAGVAVGTLAAGYVTKKISDGVFGSKASRVEAERSQATPEAARG